MAPKRMLIVLILGMGVGLGALPPESPAQLHGTSPLNLRLDIARMASLQQFVRPDDARMATLEQLIRQHALSLKPQDLSKLSSLGKPLTPFVTKPVRTPAKPAARPVSVPPEKGKINVKDHVLVAGSAKEQKATKSATQDQGQNPQPTSKQSAPLFNPYPKGPEPSVPPLPPGYYPAVRVLAPGRLDWTFVVSTLSLDPEPTLLTAGYVSTRQSYELYVPPGYDPRRPNAMIIHVAAGPRSDGWLHWQQVCRNRGVILAGVHNAGNNIPMPTRARIILDVLDDVRRRFSIDPDRTYISGMSGGGNAASRIAFALPELFGGLVAICGTWNLRLEPMLRQRVTERLSVAVVTGTGDFNGPELSREFFPVLRAHNARARLWVFPMGHAYPSSPGMDQVFQWAEAGLPLRRIGAELFLASRLVGPATPDQWSTAVLLEAGRRMEMPGEMTPALFELQGIVDRWKGLPAADMAQKLLDEFDAYSPISWKDLYRMEKLRFRYLQAHMFDGIVNGNLPRDYPVPKLNLIKIAVTLWTEILELAPQGGPVAQEAKARLAQLHQQGG